MIARERFPWSTFSVNELADVTVHVVTNKYRVRDDSIDRLPKLNRGDRVRVLSGMFVDYEGEVKSIDEQWGNVTIRIEVVGHSVPVECNRSQLELIHHG